MNPSLFRIAAILGLLSAVGPFAIDMYLPALPLIGADLDISVPQAQMTLTVYFIAFGVAQLFYGPFADQSGRRAPLFLGLGIFTIGAIGCALAPSIGWLLAARFIQGLGGAAVMVVPRAIIRDLYTGTDATRLMATVMLVISVSPMLAPLAGSGLVIWIGWRAIFWALVLAAIASLFVTRFGLAETLPPEKRVRFNFANMLRGGRTLFTDPIFMGLTFIGGFGIASFFVFIASAAFVYTGEFGLGPVQFSLAFAVNALGFFGASQLAASLGEKYGMNTVVKRAVMGFAVITCALFVLVATGFGALWVIIMMLVAANACLGLVIPSAMVLSLDNHGEIAGLASSLGGTMQMLVGGVMILAMGPFFDGTALPMTGTIALCAIAAFILSRRVANG